MPMPKRHAQMTPAAPGRALSPSHVRSTGRAALPSRTLKEVGQCLSEHCTTYQTGSSPCLFNQASELLHQSPFT